MGNYINVLWVENDPIVIKSYPGEARLRAGLNLQVATSWEEAEELLRSNYDQWQAIILDAKCKYKENDADLASRFLSNAIARLGNLYAVKGKTIPWYILSAQGEEDIVNLIPDTRLEWDGDWDKASHRPYYHKTKLMKWGRPGEEKEIPERQVLFLRIKAQVEHYNHELQIRNDLYPNVFSALERLNLNPDVDGYLLDLLEPMHFKGTDSKDYNHRYVDLRKLLENIFRDMVNKGILPPFIVSTSNSKDEVNLAWSSLFLGGEQPSPSNMNEKSSELKFWSKVKRISPPLVPKQLADFLKTAVFQTGGAVHTTASQEAINMNLENYLPHVNMSPYMLNSLALASCDFILWYENFTKEHSDPELNSLNWQLVGQKI